MTAAGFADGIDLNYVWRSENNATRTHIDQLKASGMVKITEERVTQADYSTRIVYAAEHKGLVTSAVSGSAPDVDYLIYRNFHSKGPAATYTDPQLDRIIDASRKEMDPLKRAEHIKEFQRYVAKTFNTLPGAHRFGAWRFEWPWLHNVNQAYTSRAHKHLSHLTWLDAEMPNRNGGS
jgi:ABC-type transport system substrate-binding protein